MGIRDLPVRVALPWASWGDRKIAALLSSRKKHMQLLQHLLAAYEVRAYDMVQVVNTFLSCARSRMLTDSERAAQSHRATSSEGRILGRAKMKSHADGNLLKLLRPYSTFLS